MLATETLKYIDRNTGFRGVLKEQVPASFVGETPSPLETTENGTRNGEKVFGPMGWRMSTKLVNEEKIEANSVL